MQAGTRRWLGDSQDASPTWALSWVPLAEGACLVSARETLKQTERHLPRALLTLLYFCSSIVWKCNEEGRAVGNASSNIKKPKSLKLGLYRCCNFFTMYLLDSKLHTKSQPTTSSPFHFLQESAPLLDRAGRSGFVTAIQLARSPTAVVHANLSAHTRLKLDHCSISNISLK